MFVAPKVTVLMPVFNAGPYLREAVDSILGQSFRDFELIAINDGSTDNSADILRSYQNPRLRFVENERNLGIIATLNRGLGMATGEYVARMDSDDVSLPERLAKQVAFMDAHPEVGVCGAWIRFIGDASPVTARYPEKHESIRCQLLFSNALAHPTVIMRRALLERYSLRYRDEYRSAEDYDLWRRCAGLFQLHNLPEVLLHYRVLSTGITHARGGELKETVARVMGEALDELGVQHDNETLRLHKAIGDLIACRNVVDLGRVALHLDAVQEANHEKQIYAEEEMNAVIAMLWLAACLNFRGGLPAVLAVRRKARPLQRESNVAFSFRFIGRRFRHVLDIVIGIVVRRIMKLCL
jgi:glycosyltransferase involved in cell wall biosynthesis